MAACDLLHILSDLYVSVCDGTGDTSAHALGVLATVVESVAEHMAISEEMLGKLWDNMTLTTSGPKLMCR